MPKSKRKPARSRVTAPKWLDGRSPRDIWARLEKELIEIRFFQITDHNALGRYCKYMAEWIALTDILDRDGHTYKTSSPHVEEMVRIRPEFRMRKDVEASLQALENVLGLNPRYRFAITSQLLSQKAPPAPQGDLPLAGELPEGTPKAKEEWEAILGGQGRGH